MRRFISPGFRMHGPHSLIACILHGLVRLEGTQNYAMCNQSNVSESIVGMGRLNFHRRQA
eukprot:scaffold64630_cov30-Tisochrysis_lutea.AAC.7